MSWTTSLLVAAAAVSVAGAAASQAPQTGAQRTITGTVIDTSCKFGQNLSGMDHRMCAQVCADKGIPLAILGSDGKLYIPISDKMPGDGQNARLREFAEHEVTVTGMISTAGGANAIKITTIKAK